jgi:hypothetical protein
MKSRRESTVGYRIEVRLVADFVGRITDRCGGVWIYLSYLLSDLRTGALELADLDRLPARLAQYFATNLLRRRREPEWPTEDLRLLGVLAAAFGPVGTSMLADATGVDPTAVRRVCEERYRAFLRTRSC